MSLDYQAFYENKVLFGHDDTRNIVAVEVDQEGDECRAVLFFRRDGRVETAREEFGPFLLLRNLGYMKGFPHDWSHRELSGGNDYRYVIFVQNPAHMKKLVDHLKKTTGAGPGSPVGPYLYQSDLVHQYLLITGRTLFMGMTFDGVLRMQLDIETFCDPDFEFSNPDRETDRIIVISMSDSTRWERVISGTDYDEPAMIREMLAEIQRRDPDVIEGHNLHKFDLDYIEKRAKRHRIPLKAGRDGSVIKRHNSRMTIAERTIVYNKYEIYGRHVIDTWLLAQLYDVSARDLESYGLKDIARHFRVSPPDRTYIEGRDISRVYLEDPARLLCYALDDVRETAAISRILSMPYFLQTQVFPFSYQNVSVRGNATRIDSLFIREYLHRGYSIPKPPPDRRFAGAYTDIFTTGVVKNVLHVDVASLYPSIMLTFRYFPAGDNLEIFGGLLSDLRSFRLQAKKEARSSPDRARRELYDSLQNTFKILINSFYGYLGFSFGHFADFDMAEATTGKGREIIHGMVEWLKERNCLLIELDTDGIYFTPPPGTDTPEKEESLVEELNGTLPQGISLELAGRYQAMFSYKMKNYILLDYDGGMIIKGSGLKSRGIELFQRSFIEEMFRLLLSGRKDEIPALLNAYREKITKHQWDVRDFQKSDTLQESLATYSEKLRNGERNPAAVYELALQSKKDYQPGDQLSYYVTGTKATVTAYSNCRPAHLWSRESPDENVSYYASKLNSLYKKFSGFVE